MSWLLYEAPYVVKHTKKADLCCQKSNETALNQKYQKLLTRTTPSRIVHLDTFRNPANLLTNFCIGQNARNLVLNIVNTNTRRWRGAKNALIFKTTSKERKGVCFCTSEAQNKAKFAASQRRNVCCSPKLSPQAAADGQ